MIRSVWKNVKARFSEKIIGKSIVAGDVTEAHYRTFVSKMGLWRLCSPGCLSAETIEFLEAMANLITPQEARAARDFFQMLLDAPIDGKQSHQDRLNELEKRLTEIGIKYRTNQFFEAHTEEEVLMAYRKYHGFIKEERP